MTNIKNNPAEIDVIQTTHTHRATVQSVQQLRDYCSNLVRNGQRFRIGSIYSYGNLNVDELSQTLDQLTRFGTYDRRLNNYK